MTLHELLEKPVWQMTGEELLFLTQQKVMQPEGAESEMSSAKEERHFVYGLSGLARLLGVASLRPIDQAEWKDRSGYHAGRSEDHRRCRPCP